VLSVGKINTLEP